MAKQLCWTCKNACGGCVWSAFGKPVKGWTAKETNHTTNGKYAKSYYIKECPKYKHG